MWNCDRCGARFGTRFAPIESCPRCRRRDGVYVPVTFKLFDHAAARSAQKEANAVTAPTPSQR